MFENYPDVLNITQLCSALQIGKSKAYELAKNGTISSVRVGKKILFPKVYLVQFVTACGIMETGKANYSASMEGVKNDR